MALNLASGGDGAVLLNERFRILSEEPLPDLDSLPAQAFAATELHDAGRQVFALVCDNNLPPRHDIAAVVRRIYHKNLVCFVDWGIADWPLDGRRRPVLIFERPGGSRLMAPGGGEITPFREERISRVVVPPMAQVLLEIHQQGLTHRNIHPENLFYDGPESEQANVLLGEFLAAPAAIRQPDVYEPIEFAMAEPAGRGDATAANDLYALGVTIIALLEGRRPLYGMSDEEVLAKKIALGSYAALVGERRVSITLMEALRGLLNDDPGERWTLEELEHWVGGRRLTPRQQMRPPRSARPLEFCGAELHTAREVAHAFSRNWDEAATEAADEALDVWLRRSLNRDDRTEAVNLAKGDGTGAGPAGNDETLARTCIALDPIGPIRLRRFRAMPGGLGPLLAAHYDDSEMRRLFRQVMSENLPLFWTELCLRPTPEDIRMVSTLDRLRAVVAKTMIGEGIERALYELNPTLPCRSSLLADDFIVGLDQLLPALERKAQREPASFDDLIDREMAAFISVRLKKKITMELGDLEYDKDPHCPPVAAARIFAIVQKETHAPAVPAFCSIVAKTLQGAVERYHNRERRARAADALNEAAKSGDLFSLLQVVDDQNAIAEDHSAYQQAAAEYRLIIGGLSRIAFERANRVRLSRQFGAELAALLSGAVSTIAILGIILVKLF